MEIKKQNEVILDFSQFSERDEELIENYENWVNDKDWINCEYLINEKILKDAIKNKSLKRYPLSHYDFGLSEALDDWEADVQSDFERRNLKMLNKKNYAERV